MSNVYPIPKEQEVEEIFAMLYGKELTLGSGEPVSIEGDSMLAVYVDDEGNPSTACACNYNFAAFAGSALTKIPVGGAEDAADTGDFSEMMIANLHEIMNICSRLFMTDSSPHLKLGTVYKLGDVPEEVKALFASTEERADFVIEIPNYGNGSISFLCS